MIVTVSFAVYNDTFHYVVQACCNLCILLLFFIILIYILYAKSSACDVKVEMHMTSTNSEGMR